MPAPHTRGCSVDGALQDLALTVRLAHAGVIRPKAAVGATQPSPPLFLGSPALTLRPGKVAPHTRGCPAPGRRRPPEHLRPPRIRRGAPLGYTADHWEALSAPHTRRCSAHAGHLAAHDGVRSARAEVLRTPTARTCSQVRPLRRRGGFLVMLLVAFDLARSAPHARRWTTGVS